MAFTILQNSTTADASDENENFYHVGQGSRLPMGGTSLANTDSVYDLGSATYRWNDLFCNDIDMVGSITTSDRLLWIMENEITLTATTASISFTGLNGDDDTVYRIIVKAVSQALLTTSASDMKMIINSDTSYNYGYQYLRAQSTTVVSSRGIGNLPYMVVGSAVATATSQLSLTEFILYAKTGNERMALSKLLQKSYGTYIDSLMLFACIWNNTVDTITTLSFNHDGYYLSGTHIEIWRRG